VVFSSFGNEDEYDNQDAVDSKNNIFILANTAVNNWGVVNSLILLIVMIIGVLAVISILVSLFIIERRKKKNLVSNITTDERDNSVTVSDHQKSAITNSILTTETIIIMERDNSVKEVNLYDDAIHVEVENNMKNEATSSPQITTSSSNATITTTPTTTPTTTSTTIVSPSLPSNLSFYGIRRADKITKKSPLSSSTSSLIQNESKNRRTSLGDGRSITNRKSLLLSTSLSGLRRSSLSLIDFMRTKPLNEPNKEKPEDNKVNTDGVLEITIMTNDDDSMEEIDLNDDVIISEPASLSPSPSSSSISRIRRASLIFSEFFTPPTISSFPKIKREIPPTLFLDDDENKSKKINGEKN